MTNPAPNLEFVDEPVKVVTTTTLLRAARTIAAQRLGLSGLDDPRLQREHSRSGGEGRAH